MTIINETVRGIVSRITYHNPDNGWSVLRVHPFGAADEQITVTVHQTKVFAGATMEFRGAWTVHPQFGRQFKATEAIEKKPASAAALEKYLGSGLIKGVGPSTAKKIVGHFGKDTLHVFENTISRLMEVPGIARKKLAMIEEAWREHRMVREVMIFLQGHGVSTLFSVRIYKKYGEKAIDMVLQDPYRLANDFYGIGFFSADKVALSIGLAEDSQPRLMAAVKHILAASREQGHCYLTAGQIAVELRQLLAMDCDDRLESVLAQMQEEDLLRLRLLAEGDATAIPCYYSKSLYYDEEAVARRLRRMIGPVECDKDRLDRWIAEYCTAKAITLSDEQREAVQRAARQRCSVLTGGPGCGKTTTTLVIVRLLEAMRREVLLAAPTGRAAQRMSEVIGREARTIHRLLEWQNGSFQRNEEHPLSADFLIVDESSMLDISLTAALLKAVPEGCQLLFIGDADQLPSVGAGNVLRDIIASRVIPVFRLTQVFRQASASLIIRYAHQINAGEIPAIASPFKSPEIWRDGSDCLFLDSDEATKEQIDFVTKVKRTFNWQIPQWEGLTTGGNPFEFRTAEVISSSYEQDIVIPEKFRHVDLDKVRKAEGPVQELMAVLKKIHPWSTLHYGLSAIDTVVRLYREWIPKYQGEASEIQILCPMVRGTLGTANVNKVIQMAVNPAREGRRELQVGERIFREGDRVIHRRNNYDLGVFNGDIGEILAIDNEDLTCVVRFFPEGREVRYQKEDVVELDLAYAITIHKSQGSEFQAVIIPVLSQHFRMLYRNLIYTGLTRARRLAVFVGTRKAMAMAVRQEDTAKRQTALVQLLRSGARSVDV